MVLIQNYINAQWELGFPKGIKPHYLTVDGHEYVAFRGVTVHQKKGRTTFSRNNPRGDQYYISVGNGRWASAGEARGDEEFKARLAKLPKGHVQRYIDKINGVEQAA